MCGFTLATYLRLPGAMNAKLLAITIIIAVIVATVVTLVLKSLDLDLPSGVEGGIIGGVIGATTAVIFGVANKRKKVADEKDQQL